MTPALNKLLNIRTEEWPRVLPLFLMSAMTNAGAIWGLSVVYAAFLKLVGVEALPWILVFSSLLSVAAVALYTAFADRVSNNRLMFIIFAAEVFGILLGLGLLWLGHPTLAYPFFYLLLLASVAVINPHQITYFNSFYNTQSAKRTLPVIFAGSRVGAIVAGLTMPLLTAWFNSPTLIAFWLGARLAVMALVWLMPLIIKEKKADDRFERLDRFTLPADKKRASHLDNMKEGLHYTIQSTYLRWMAAGTFLMMLLMAFLEYRYSQILLNNVDDLAGYVGLLMGVGNAIALPLLLFGMSRFIAWVGLGNASLVFPIGTLFISGGFIAAPGVASASAAYLDRSAFRLAVQVPIDGLLYNAVPLRVKGRARGFVNGLVVPIGSLIGGLLLLLPLVATPWFVPGLIALLAIIYMGSALVIRRLYSRALIEMLEQEDYSFLFSQEASDLSAADPAALASLELRLEESDDPDFIIFIAQLISQVGGGAAAPILRRALEKANNPPLKAALIDVMSAANIRGQTILPLYTKLLTDPDGDVRRAALSGLEQLSGAKDPAFRKIALDALYDPDAEVRMQAFSALTHSEDFYQIQPAVDALDQLLRADDPLEQAQGIRILGRIANFRAWQSLMSYLDSPADEVRLEALTALESLPDALTLTKMRAPLMLEAMSRRLDDPIERTRQTALTMLGRIGGQEAYRAMAKALADPAPQVRMAAVEALARAGRENKKEAVAVIEIQLETADMETQKMASATLGKIDPRKFEPLILSHINHTLQSIYRNHAYLQALNPYAEYSGAVVLQSVLEEENQRLLDEIFYLLAALHGPEAIAVITDSLNSDSKHTRANALEALESLTAPQMLALIAPFFDPDIEPAQRLRLGQENWQISPPTAEEALQHFTAQEDDPWLQAVGLFTQEEINGSAAVFSEEYLMLSDIEKVIFLKKIPFFHGMTINQLKIVAPVCEELFFKAEERIFEQGDPGGALYTVVSGKVSIEQAGRRRGSYTRLATIGPNDAFGEMTLFDGSSRTAAAAALQDTLALRIRREPLIALARQNPELSLELIGVLSQRLREANEQVARLTRSKPRALHKLYDALEG